MNLPGPRAHGTGVRTVPGRREQPYDRETVFARMVHEHQAGLWRYLRYLGCEPALAEDLVQEVFLAVWQRPFEDRGPADAVRAALAKLAA